MKIKSLAMLGALAISMIPVAAFADMNIRNNSNTPATAIAGLSPCSSAAGERGVMQPHSQVTIPDFLVGLYCRTNCKVEVYMDKHCSTKSVATVIANVKDGVIQGGITNHDTSPDGYRVEGSGKNISIEGGPQRKWYQLLF